MQQQNFSTLSLWLLAIRPKTLPAAIGPIAVGTAAATVLDGFALLPALACMLGALLLQVGVNLANDYFDFKNQVDSEARLGPVRVTQAGLIPPDQVRLAMGVSLALAGLVFVYLSLLGGLPIVVIGLASVLAALAYSGGPYPLASHALGEVFVFLFFGPVAVVATCFVQLGRFSLLALVFSICPGLLISAIMVVNNLRDIETDRPAGKNTLAVRLGRKGTIALYRIMVVGAQLVPVLLVFLGGMAWSLLLPLLTAPVSLVLCRKVGSLQGRELNRLLAETALLSLLFALLLSFGLVIGYR